MTQSAQWPQLEKRYGPLAPLSTGMQGRVYVSADGANIVKIYRQAGRGQATLEAANMRRAGLGSWVVEVAESGSGGGGGDALVMRRFAGRRVKAETLPPALPALRRALERLHAQQCGAVDTERVHHRLSRFRRVLVSQGLDDLFAAVEQPLHAGELEGPASFCHLDLWQDNVLVDGGQVLIVDWAKASWDDPLRDIALLKTGTLDLLGADDSLQAALSFLPDQTERTHRCFRAYLSLTYLHDLYWLMMNEPYEFSAEKAHKLPRARHVLASLPA